MKICAADQKSSHASFAHFSKGDLLWAGEGGHIMPPM
jgi:hypothetical protein